MTSPVKIVFFDLDGTLLSSDKQVSTVNIDCLNALGKKKILRVVSTGRSLYSYKKLLGRQILPTDYLIVSNGSGILKKPGNTLLKISQFNENDVERIRLHLMAHGVNFMIHEKVPDNHSFKYVTGKNPHSDFQRRIELYSIFSEEYSADNHGDIQSSQIIAILPGDPELLHSLSHGLEDYQITRTTSPLDGKSIWMEIYPPNISKGKSAEWLCHHLAIERQFTFAIGNDYNDVSLLEFANISYIVNNGPADLRSRYRNSLSNDDNGFRDALYDAGVLG